MPPSLSGVLSIHQGATWLCSLCRALARIPAPPTLSHSWSHPTGPRHPPREGVREAGVQAAPCSPRAEPWRVALPQMAWALCLHTGTSGTETVCSLGLQITLRWERKRSPKDQPLRRRREVPLSASLGSLIFPNALKPLQPVPHWQGAGGSPEQAASQKPLLATCSPHTGSRHLAGPHLTRPKFCR